MAAMKACLDLHWNMLANEDPGNANWANQFPVDIAWLEKQKQ